MSDLFQCDHCQKVMPKAHKKGVIIVQKIPWADGIQFPSETIHTHDLCQPCLGKVLELFTRRRLPETSQKKQLVTFREWINPWAKK